MVEDNDAVIKMIAKGRAPLLKRIARTHRVYVDFIIENFKKDPAVQCRYIHTALQLADLLTKGSFTAESWMRLCSLHRLGPAPSIISKSAVIKYFSASVGSHCWQPSAAALYSPGGVSTFVVGSSALLRIIQNPSAADGNKFEVIDDN